MRWLAALLLTLALATPAHATIVATVLTQGNCTYVASAGCTTASITPVSGQLILVWATNPNSNAIDVAGTNGLNVTWTAVKQAGANAGDISLLRGVPSSGTAGTLNIKDHSSANSTVHYVVVTYAAVNQTTNQGIVQADLAVDNGSVTSLTITLGAVGSTRNALVYSAFSKNVNTTFTAAAGYSSVTQASAGGTLGVAFKVSATTNVVNGGTFGSATDLVAIAAELPATNVAIRHRANIQ